MARYGSSEGPSGGPGTPGNGGEDPTRFSNYAGPGPGQRPPGPPPTPVGPPGQPYQPSDAPTQYASYPPPEYPQPGMPAGPDFGGAPPVPWFRRRPVLIAWVALIAAMIALVIWGIIQLTSRGPGPSTSPSGTSSSSTTSTTTSSTTTTAPSTSATESAAPPQPQAPHQEAPRQPAPAPAAPTEEPEHHHHLPPLPSVITIPPIPKAPEIPTVITLPPHL